MNIPVQCAFLFPVNGTVPLKAYVSMNVIVPVNYNAHVNAYVTLIVIVSVNSCGRLCFCGCSCYFELYRSCEC